MKPVRSLSRNPNLPKARSEFKVPVSWRIGGSLFLAMTATLLIYLSSFGFKYTNWDDPMYIHGNVVIRELSASNIKKMFTEPAVLNYHPITLLSLALDYARAKDMTDYQERDPAPFHQTNILFHLLNVVLVFFFIYKLSGKKTLVAFLVAFLFGTHPMHVESVSWISERKDVLFTFFFVLSLIFYLKFTEKRRITMYLAAFLMFALSVLSKPAAAPLGFILFFMDYYSGRLEFRILKPATWLRIFRFPDNRVLLEKIPFIVLGIITLYVTYIIQARVAIVKFETFTVYQRLLFSTYGFCEYLIKLFVPNELSAFYPYPALSTGGYLPVFFYASLWIFILLLAGSIALENKTRLVFFGLVFYLLMLIPVLQFISVGGAIMSERYSYVPYIGIFFILAMGIDFVWNSQHRQIKVWRYPLMLVTALYLGTMTVVAMDRTQVWRNSETLWTDVIAKHPAVMFAYENRGIHYVSKPEQYDQALEDFLTAERMGTKNPFIYKQLALIYVSRNEIEKSTAALNKQLKYDSTDKQAYVNRGLNYAKLKQYDTAFMDYNHAYRLDPEFDVMYANRSYAYYETKQYEKSVSDYTWLIKKKPAEEKYWFYRAMSKANLGDYRNAIIDFKECAKLSPKDGEVSYNMGLCYYKINDFKTAFSFVKLAQSQGFEVDPAISKMIEGQLKK